MKKIGIIGRGFVGRAVENSFSYLPELKTKLFIYDKNPSLSLNTLRETVNESEIIFLSIPTPSNKDGSLNIDSLNHLFNEISLCMENDGIILLRSTILPGTSKTFKKKFPNLNIVFNPEFLTEENANKDFANQSRIVLGGDDKLTNKVSKFYQWRFGRNIPILRTSFETAEFIKYMSNCFLATKVSFMNEMKNIADVSNVDWKKAVEGFVLDPRIGSSHTKVPGPDKKVGFGGSCLPKDMQAFISFATQLGISPNVLVGAWETNLKLRPKKDWEKLVGRAVVEKIK